MLPRMLLTALVLCTGMAKAEVDVNQADVAALDSIRGIGPSMSRQILAERESSTFKNWGDLMARIPGIKAKAAAKLSTQGMTVNGQSFADTPKPLP